jgi:hypothetical protein
MAKFVITEALTQEVREVDDDIARHCRAYADDQWDRFAAVRKLTYKQLEQIKEKAGV